MKIKALLLVFAAALCINCTGPQQNSNSSSANNGDPNRKLKIGFAMDTLKEERWVRDKEAFEAACKKLGVEPVVTVADNKADKQANDVDNLLHKALMLLSLLPMMRPRQHRW